MDHEYKQSRENLIEIYKLARSPNNRELLEALKKGSNDDIQAALGILGENTLSKAWPRIREDLTNYIIEEMPPEPAYWYWEEEPPA